MLLPLLPQAELTRAGGDSGNGRDDRLLLCRVEIDEQLVNMADVAAPVVRVSRSIAKPGFFGMLFKPLLVSGLPFSAACNSNTDNRSGMAHQRSTEKAKNSKLVK